MFDNPSIKRQNSGLKGLSDNLPKLNRRQTSLKRSDVLKRDYGMSIEKSLAPHPNERPYRSIRDTWL
jgi:hypothetical protein